MYFFIFMFFSPDTSFLFSSSYIHQNTAAEIQSVGIRAWKEGCHSLRESLPREWEVHPAWLLSHPPSSPARVSRALDFLCIWFGVIISDKQSPGQKRLISPLILKQAQTFHLPSLLNSSSGLDEFSNHFYSRAQGHSPNPFTISTCHGSWEISEIQAVSLFPSK